MSFPRYESYKDSGLEWLGEVPEHWRVVRLRFLCQIETGDADTANAVDDGEYPFFVRSSIVETIGRFTHNCEAVLTAGDGVGVGKVFHHFEGKFCAHQRVYIFRGFREIKGRFFYHYMKELFLRVVLEGTAKSTVDSLRRPMIADFWITVPLLQEQQNIATFLDCETSKIDTLIAEQQRLIELLKEKRQAVISHAVTKGLNPSVPMKDSGIEWLGDVPKHWEISRLGFESWVRARLGWKGLKAEEYVDDGFAFLATPNIKGTSIDFENVNFINEYRYDESPEIKLQVDDVLLAKDGSTLGIVNVVRSLPRPTTVNSSIAVITPNQSLNGIFLYYLFQSFYMENTIQRIKGGMGVPHLFQADLNKFYIPLPTIEEQQIIASFLDCETAKIDELTAEAKTVINLLQERRTALISAAVTGKIDVRGLVSANPEVEQAA